MFLLRLKSLVKSHLVSLVHANKHRNVCEIQKRETIKTTEPNALNGVKDAITLIRDGKFSTQYIMFTRDTLFGKTTLNHTITLSNNI